MTKDERIYALFVEANPFQRPEELSDVPVTDQSTAAHLQVVGGEVYVGTPPPARPRSIRGLSIAATVLALVGFTGLLLRNGATPDPSAGVAPQIARVHEFMDRVDGGDVDGAVELLEDPLGAIYFPAIDEVTTTAQVADYLEFYLAVGGRTTLSDCTAEASGPRVIVTCQADQQVEVLIPIGLEFPVFQLTFEVWDAGIRSIAWDASGGPGISEVFFSSRFFEFRNLYMAPNGLVQGNGAPVWSHTNGEAVKELVREFLAGQP